MFDWLTRKRTRIVDRPVFAAFRFDKIDPVKRSAQYGNTGPQGWGVTLWGFSDGDEFMYRHLLETFAAQNRDALLTLPEWTEYEDLIEGELLWRSHTIWVWYEIVLTHIWLWSSDKQVMEDLRVELMKLVEAS